LPPCFQQGLPEGFVPIRGVHGLQAEPFWQWAARRPWPSMWWW
jgi:hypothetical protein